jgi:hypothetical protein
MKVLSRYEHPHSRGDLKKNQIDVILLQQTSKNTKRLLHKMEILLADGIPIAALFSFGCARLQTVFKSF